MKTRADVLIAKIQDLKAEREPWQLQKVNSVAAIKEINRDCMSPAQNEIDRITEEIQQAQDELTELQKAPRASDHAVIRYLERKHGFCFEDVRQQLLTDTVISAMEFGATSVKVDGMTLRLRDKCVVTVV